MKKQPNILAIVLLLVVSLYVSSCKKGKNTTVQYDHFIFGRFYGMCGGEECIEIFKLEQNKLYEDTRDQYPSNLDFYNGTYLQLSGAKYDATKDIVNYFPTDILNEKDTVIGSPDAGDWGGLYIEYDYNGVHRFWLLDKMKSNVPGKYHLFIDKVNEKIDSLK